MASAALGYIGPYRLLNVVHTGQTSQIWQAYHDGKRQLFGIKTLLNNFHGNREHIAMLRWEHMVGHKLDSDRVIQIYECGANRETHYLAMQWFSSPNMKRHIYLGVKKIAWMAPKIIEQAAEGLAYFNSHGWVHRDVKPDNFLVTDEGEVKLIDFALAQRSKRGIGKLFASKSKVQGTRSYMSPEQIRGKPLDQRADVYSFACTVHELISGRAPYTGVSADDLLRKHLRSPPPSLEGGANGVTPEFAELVRRSLAKDPARRPDSLEEFLAEFRACRVFKTPPKRAAKKEDSKTSE